MRTWLTWLTMVQRIRRKVLQDHVFLISAGIAFLAILALFPTFSAILSFYGLVTSAAQLQHELEALRVVVPPGIIQLLNNNLHSLTRQSGGILSLNIAVSSALAIWVATRAVMGIIGALNIVYDESEDRGVVEIVATAIGLAIGSLLFWVGALLAIVGAPIILSQLDIDSTLLSFTIHTLRWLLTAVVILISMTLLYFFGPSHHHPRWHWLSVGSVFATLLWLAGSALLSFYTSHVSDFSSIYGQLGVVVILQLWFFLTSFAFLIGAEINVALEKHMHSLNSDGHALES